MSVAIAATDYEVSYPPFVVCAHRGGLDVIDQLAREWRELCATALDDQPFYRPEFIRAHVRAAIPSAKVVILTVREQGELLLVLPLVEELATFSKIPVRRLRAPVNLHCGRFDAVRKQGLQGDAAVAAAWDYLREMAGWDMLHLRYSPSGSTVSCLVAKAQAEGLLTIEVPDRPSPYVPLPSDPDSLKGMPPNSKLRSQLRQIRRRMAEEGSLKFCRSDTADGDVLSRLFSLEASGWKGRHRSAVNCNPQTRQFFDELAESAAHFGYLSLYSLEFRGELIAAHYSLAYKGLCYSPIVAHNEKFRQFAPGHLMVGAIIGDCVVRGFRGYDITGEDQDWKMKWATKSIPISHYYVFRGRLGNLAYRVESRLGARARSLLRRKPAQKGETGD